MYSPEELIRQRKMLGISPWHAAPTPTSVRTMDYRRAQGLPECVVAYAADDLSAWKKQNNWYKKESAQ